MPRKCFGQPTLAVSDQTRRGERFQKVINFKQIYLFRFGPPTTRIDTQRHVDPGWNVLPKLNRCPER